MRSFFLVAATAAALAAMAASFSGADSTAVGVGACAGASKVNSTFVAGADAANGATDVNGSVIIGAGAGIGASHVTNCVFIGAGAGLFSTRRRGVTCINGQILIDGETGNWWFSPTGCVSAATAPIYGNATTISSPVASAVTASSCSGGAVTAQGVMMFDGNILTFSESGGVLTIRSTSGASYTMTASP